MSPRSAQYIATATAGTLMRGRADTEIGRLCTDSRTVAAGDGFLALSGEKHDAHGFLGEVVSRGARLLIVNRSRMEAVPADAQVTVIAVDDTRLAYGRLGAAYRREFQMPLVAIGGSNGKTTTKGLVADLLKSLGPVVASEASYNNDVGVPATLLRLDATTRVAVVEVGTNHPGELAPLVAMAAPSIGVITSLGREHLEFFGDLDGVIREEGALAEGLPGDGLLIVNGDSEGIGAVTSRTRARVLRCGMGAGNDWRAERLGGDAAGSDIAVWAPERDFCGRYRLNILGRHMIGNALLALAVAAKLGVPAEEARRALALAQPSRMRMSSQEIGGIRLLDDAYNANPDSMLAALQTLNDLPCAGRRVAVLGYMAELGPHAETAHAEVGRAAAKLGVERLFTVGRHAELMAGAAREASPIQATAFASAGEAARAAFAELRAGDTLLVKASRSTHLEEVVQFLRQELSLQGKNH